MSDAGKIVTRFAPSPTGFLHIGGARTALYNWLLARGADSGIFHLRIEDTDRKRSTPEAIEAIIDGMQWLGLAWDGDIVYQSKCQGRHAEVVKELLKAGQAYKCYASAEDLQKMRDDARKAGKSPRYDGRWRDRDPADAPEGIDPVIRIKAPQTGETVIEDAVQGRVRVDNETLDDFVIMRSDGTPTYMLSVVVDDHDMGITHVVRGDDHLTNAFRQTVIYKAMDWDAPVFAHIPLIHGPDGAKLSKRHGALGVDAYREMGYLPEALRNYLLRLGWGKGDVEIISTEEAKKEFSLDRVGRGAARFDFAKLESINAYYLRGMDNTELAGRARYFLEKELERNLGDADITLLITAMEGLKPRAKTLVDLAKAAVPYFLERPIQPDEKAKALLETPAPAMIGEIAAAFASLDDWSDKALLTCAQDFAKAKGMKLGAVAQPLRAALTGTAVSPSVFEMMAHLGREESLARLNDAAKKK